MWTMTKNKVTDFCDQIMERLHLNVCSILKWYSIILFVAPLLYWLLLEFRAITEKITLLDMMQKQPTAAISIIVAITDFLLGYYCWIKKNSLVKDLRGLKVFWVCQSICQLFVGNLICLILSILGLRALRNSDSVNETVPYFKIAIVISTVLYVLCISLLGLIGLKELRG